MLVLLLFAAAPPLDDPLPPGAVARLGSSFLDGRYHAQDLAFRPDGKLIFAGGRGVGVWDIEKKRLLALHPGGPYYRALPAGDAALVAGYSLSLVEPGRAQRWTKDKLYSTAVAVGHDGTWFAWATPSQLVFADMRDGENTYRVHIPISRVAASPRLAACPTRPEVALLTADGDLSVRVRGRDSPLWTAHGHAPARREYHHGAAAYSADGGLIATSFSDRTVRLWDARTGKPGRVLTRGGPVAHALAFSRDGTLAASFDDTTVRLYDPASGKERVIQTGAPQHRLSFSPDGKVLASASGERQLAELWDVVTGKRLHEPEGHLDTVAALRFVEDGRIVSVDQGGRVVDWRLGGASRAVTLPHQAGYRNFALSPDGTRVAEGGRAPAVHDTAGGKLVARLAGDASVFNLAFRAGGVMGLGGGGGLRWGPNGALAKRAPMGVRPGWTWFLPNGTQALQGDRLTLVLVDLASGARRVVRRDEQPPFQPAMLAFTPDGAFAAWTTFGKVILADAHTWEAVLALPHDGGMPAAVALSRDGRRLAVTRVGNGTSDILCYDAVAGKKLFDRPLPRSVLMHCPPDFSPDGSKLATATGRTVLVWEVPPRVRAAKPDDAGLERCWVRLAGKPEEAHRAGWEIVDAGATRFLIGKLKPAEPADAKLLARLIADLDDDDFDKRTRAEQDLIKLGRQAEAAMLRALAGKPSLDVYRRLERLLAAVRASPESLRMSRAVAVLARLGTAEALEKLAGQKTDPRLAAEAREALARLKVSHR